jgi:hypothetical protein
MFNEDKTELKAIMWSTYVHFNLLKQRREIHSDEFMKLFKEVVSPVEEELFEKRILFFKNQKI